jgi:hypothetical protein
VVSDKQVRAAEIHAPRSTVHMGFQTPPFLSTFKQRGGGPPLAFLPLSRGGSGIGSASLQRSRSARPDQRGLDSPTLLSCPSFNSHGPSFPVVSSLYHPSPFPSVPFLVVRWDSLPLALPHSSPSVHLPSSEQCSLSPRLITHLPPTICPTHLHAHSSSRLVIPSGSARSLPRRRSTELTGPSSIPMKQLLKQLVVVRHRLRHNGKVRRRIKGTSIHLRSCQKSDCVRRWCTIIQRLQAQIVRSHADAMCLMRRLDFVVVVVLSICRRFRHFCIYRW